MTLVPSFPPEPDVPEKQRASGKAPVRYEDIAQDGRVKLLALPPAIGHIMWQQSISDNEAIRKMQHEGVVPILTRFIMESGGGPFSVRRPLSAQGCYELSHTVDDTGAVNRLMLNIWVHLSAPIGRTHGPPPPRAGEMSPAGRVLAEHVFTKPFAPPDQRRVLRFDLPGEAAVPPVRYTWRPPEATIELPPGARVLDPEPVADPVVHSFGLVHTDANQHVNSLVYPRLFEEAALRRLQAHGRPLTLLASFCEIAYRKPCFAGDRMRILLRCFEDAGGAGALGTFVPDADPTARPHCYLMMRFR